MSRQRRRSKGSRSLHLSITATDEEWENVRRNAAQRRLSIARYLVGLALGEDSDTADGTGPEVALDPSDRRKARFDKVRRTDVYPVFCRDVNHTTVPKTSPHRRRRRHTPQDPRDAPDIAMNFARR